MKTPSSRTVRFFLSSTFQDFGEERDLLVRRVFPALRARLKERFVELVDVDLRWGITVEQAQRGEVLPICLAEIDRARPYFIGMLGERYGWIPPSDGFAADLLERQRWLRSHRGGKSVTELEILHGVLNPRRMQGRAFFYFRAPAYAKARGGAYLPASIEDQARQSELKRRIQRSGHPVAGYRDPQSLARRLERDLWTLLDAEFPATSVPDAFERETLRHLAYAESRRRLYLGDARTVDALESALLEGHSHILIEGASGLGKSALLANGVARWRQQHPRHAVHEHYLGASAEAADSQALIRRLCEFIRRTTSSPDRLASDPQALIESLPSWLATGGAWARKRRTRMLIVLDSLNSLTRLQDLQGWPAFLPQGLTLVVSCLPGPVLDALKAGALKAESASWARIRVRALGARDRRAVLVASLARFNKVLPASMLAQALRHPLSGHPLFLRTLAEELRLFGVHEALQQRLDECLACPTLEALYARVLHRVEGDCGERAVRAALSAISASRAGLTEKEILGIAGLLPAAWAPIRNALDDALIDANGKINFSHDDMRQSVQVRYLPDEHVQRRVHRRLARWFAQVSDEARRAEEEPWQWAQAQAWPDLARALRRLDLMQAGLSDRPLHEWLSYWVALERVLGIDTAQTFLRTWRGWNARGLLHSEGRAVSKDALKLLARMARFLVDANRPGPSTQTLVRVSVEQTIAARGASHPESLQALLVQANLHRMLARYDAAEALYRQVLTVHRRRLGEDHPDTLSCMSNLALVLTDAGRATEAQGLHEVLVDRARALHGAHHEETLSALNNLGLNLDLAGRWPEARKVLEEVVTLARRHLGKDHPSLGEKINNLANVHFREGRPELALELHGETHRIWLKAFGPNSPKAATTLNNRGFILMSLARYGEAEPLLQEALAVYEHALGTEHPHTLLCANSIATLMARSGRRREAMRRFASVLTRRERVLGADHPQTALTRSRLQALRENPRASI